MLRAHSGKFSHPRFVGAIAVASVFLLVLTIAARELTAATDVASGKQAAGSVVWSFESEELDAGGTTLVPGPRPPRFPDFDETNLARRFRGNGDRIEMADAPGLRFGEGDSITLEAWVAIDEIANDHNVYIVGK